VVGQCRSKRWSWCVFDSLMVVVLHLDVVLQRLLLVTLVR